MKIAITLLALACASPAAAIELRPFVTLADSVIRMQDLFEGGGARVLGPAPAPGGRIVVEAAQLSAIARQFAVDWRPASPADRVVLERPGRPLTREDVASPLRAALMAAGAPRDSDIDMPPPTAPLMPAQAALRVDVSQLEFDAGTGRFTALLALSADGMAPAQVRVSGRIVETMEVPVPRRRLMPGEVVAAGDLEWARLRAGQFRGDLVRTPAQAVGLALRHSVQPGQPIPVNDLGRPVVIAKGTTVLMSIDSPGIQLTAQGIAMEPAGLGERVQVLNPLSRVVVEAEVTGPGRARVMPGTAPLIVSNRQIVAR